MAIIEVDNITKQFKIQKRKSGLWGNVISLFKREYEIKKAVDGISFQIQEGEIVGYIGPNGAGKSTTIKMLVGILHPSSGTVRINGYIPQDNRKNNAKNMGVVFGQRTQLWWDIPLSESLQLMKYMYKISEKTFKKNLSYYSEVLGLWDFMQIPVRQLSLGQRMRAEICVALLHDPKLLYLDEPTIGLDVVVKEKIRNAIKDINKERKITVILTTHDMSDIEKLCNRVIVVDKGKSVYDGNLDHLVYKYGSVEKMFITLKKQGDIEIDQIRDIGVSDLLIDRNNIELIYDSKVVNSALIVGWFMQHNYVMLDFSVKTMEIEEVIRNVYALN